MRETTARGNTAIYMPKDRQTATHKLGELSALAAARDWERAALVALLVTNKSKGGRPRKNVATGSDVTRQYTVSEFIKIGVYGFRSHAAVDAYLRAWGASGLPVPVWGAKVELPSGEFPDMAELYGRSVAGELDEAEDEGTGEDEEAEDEPEEGSPSSTRQGSSVRGRSEKSALDKFLEVIDHLPPEIVILGQAPERVDLLIKTIDSWLESLREAAEATREESD